MTSEKIYNSDRSSPKTSIIKFILSDGPVSEPDIRGHLKKIDKSLSQATVNRYLRDLAGEPACIELIEPIKKSRSNYWNITKIEHLKNIKSYYPEISLNEFEKSFVIILHEWGEDTISRKSLKIYMQLLLSTSLFNECIVSGVEVLLSRAWQMYLCDDGFENDWRIKKIINNFYSEYVRDNLGFEVSNDTFRKNLEELIPNIDEISEEMFLRIFEERFPGFSKEMSIDKFLKIEEEINQRMSDHSISNKVWEECLYERIGEKFPEWENNNFAPAGSYLEFLREINHIKDEISEEILREKMYKKILEEKLTEWSKKGIPTEMYREAIDRDLIMYRKITEILSLMKKQQETFKMSSSKLLLKHFFDHDILTGMATNEEIRFTKNIRTNIEIRNDFEKSHDLEGMLRTELLGDLKYESEIIFKYKKPSIFSNNCNTPDDVYQRLIDFFGFRSLLH